MQLPSWQLLSSYLTTEKNLDFGKDNEKRYFRRYRIIEGFFGLKEVTRESIRDFFQYINARSVSISSRNNYFTLLKHACELTKNTEISYFSLAKRPKKLDTHIILSEQEIIRVIEYETPRPPQWHWLNKRYSLAIKTMYMGALRIGELCNLRIEDIFEEYIFLRDTKNGNDYKQPLPKELIQEILTLPRYKHGYVFGSPTGPLEESRLREELKKRCLACEIPQGNKVKLHSLRHSRLTHLARDGADLELVRKLARHSNLNTTQQYIHLNPSLVKKVMLKTALSHYYGYDGIETIHSRIQESLLWLNEIGYAIDYSIKVINYTPLRTSAYTI